MPVQDRPVESLPVTRFCVRNKQSNFHQLGIQAGVHQARIILRIDLVHLTIENTITFEEETAWISERAVTSNRSTTLGKALPEPAGAVADSSPPATHRYPGNVYANRALPLCAVLDALSQEASATIDLRTLHVLSPKRSFDPRDC